MDEVTPTANDDSVPQAPRILIVEPNRNYCSVLAMRINERYQPFVGIDLTWKGRLQTNVAWNRSNAYSVSTSTFALA